MLNERKSVRILRQGLHAWRSRNPGNFLRLASYRTAADYHQVRATLLEEEFEALLVVLGEERELLPLWEQGRNLLEENN